MNDIFKIAVTSSIVSVVVLMIVNNVDSSERDYKRRNDEIINKQKEEIKNLKLSMKRLDRSITYERGQRIEAMTPKECKKEQTIIDLKNGTLAGLRPDAEREEIKMKLPCFKYDDVQKDMKSNYGGGVFYGDHDFYFYTADKRINIREDFRGVTDKKEDASPSFIRYIKHNSEGIGKIMYTYDFELTKQDKNSYGAIKLYRTPYGCLQFQFNGNDDKSMVREINITTKPCEKM